MSAPIHAAMIGSGTMPYVRSILASGQRGNDNTGLAAGERIGLQVMVGNPEDLSSVDAFLASGITVGTSPTQIFSKDRARLAGWPRTRLVRVENATDSTSVTIANSAAKTPEGWVLTNGAGGARASVDLPVLDAVEIWAVASATSQVRMLLF